MNNLGLLKRKEIKLFVTIYVNLIHLQRESQLGDNSLLFSQWSTRFHPHHMAVELMSADGVQSER